MNQPIERLLRQRPQRHERSGQRLAGRSGAGARRIESGRSDQAPGDQELVEPGLPLPEAGVADQAVAEADPALPLLAGEDERAGLPAEMDDLQDVGKGEIFEIADDALERRALVFTDERVG